METTTTSVILGTLGEEDRIRYRFQKQNTEIIVDRHNSNRNVFDMGVVYKNLSELSSYILLNQLFYLFHQFVLKNGQILNLLSISLGTVVKKKTFERIFFLTSFK